ncbi:hypothetical protein QYM36_009697, partial [Artemia franciscana]
MVDSNSKDAIRAVLFSEFHPQAGPKITYQVPENYVTKETFDAISAYIIPKPQLQHCTISLNMSGCKIVGFPCKIEHQRYTRNALQFNLCFVFDTWARTAQYELTVQKFAEYLVTLEKEKSFISEPETCSQLPSIMEKVMTDINLKKSCTVKMEPWTLYLKVVRLAPDPPPVEDYDVPVLTDDSTMRLDQWDLTTQQVLPYIDGVNHVMKIGALSDVALELVKACLKNLLYYQAVRLQPFFLYSNIYAVTPQFKNLLENLQMQSECLAVVSRSERFFPSFRDVVLFYSSLTYGATLKDVCVRLSPHNLKIDERALIQFGLTKGIIRRVNKYPIYDNGSKSPDPVQRLFDGSNSLDAICCKLGKSSQDMEEKIEGDPDVVV